MRVCEVKGCGEPTGNEHRSRISACVAASPPGTSIVVKMDPRTDRGPDLCEKHHAVARAVVRVFAETLQKQLGIELCVEEEKTPLGT